MKYKTMKVFDCQKMPQDVMKMFFVWFRDSGNDDCYFVWHIND